MANEPEVSFPGVAEDLARMLRITRKDAKYVLYAALQVGALSWGMTAEQVAMAVKPIWKREK